MHTKDSTNSPYSPRRPLAASESVDSFDSIDFPDESTLALVASIERTYQERERQAQQELVILNTKRERIASSIGGLTRTRALPNPLPDLQAKTYIVTNGTIRGIFSNMTLALAQTSRYKGSSMVSADGWSQGWAIWNAYLDHEFGQGVCPSSYLPPPRVAPPSPRKEAPSCSRRGSVSPSSIPRAVSPSSIPRPTVSSTASNSSRGSNAPARPTVSVSQPAPTCSVSHTTPARQNGFFAHREPVNSSAASPRGRISPPRASPPRVFPPRRRVSPPSGRVSPPSGRGRVSKAKGTGSGYTAVDVNEVQYFVVLQGIKPGVYTDP
ncbi:hypothetical protein BD410DRAFT_810623 [Rickenella mellea]|uniref:Uncharacterized protein n=1 Tax=Rickenella mellea TaxID=50990 RepID=A0A4Y7PDH4_9AGAM|nr:hypothetical protein BD410DRAFT_810623 [Rickenella mellea]